MRKSVTIKFIAYAHNITNEVRKRLVMIRTMLSKYSTVNSPIHADVKIFNLFPNEAYN